MEKLLGYNINFGVLFSQGNPLVSLGGYFYSSSFNRQNDEINYEFSIKLKFGMVRSIVENLKLLFSKQ